MANFIFKSLHKLRFLIVGALVMTLISAPWGANAGSKNPSDATITAADSTIAGLSTEIAIEGKSYEPVEVSVTKPNGSQLVLEAITNASGEAELTLADYHVRTAGIYTVEARHLDKSEGYGPAKTFEVYPGAVSDTKSTVDINKSTAQAGETLEMLIRLQDSYENPIDGHVLKVAASKEGIDIYSPSYTTDENGEMTFYITSEIKGITDLTVFDTSSNKTLTEKAKIAFTTGTKNFDQGGWGDNYNPVVLSAESGQIDSFLVSTDDSSVEVGETVTVTATAIDEDGFTVSDYTGEIRFSSSDEEATLPDDYTFEADDLGEHTFSLSVKFITPGEQTLTITDTDQTTVEGETTFEVIDEDANYDADFETEDFERDGDFTLISPASGSYSADTVEVQGEADYGYFAIIYVNEEEAGRVEIEFDNTFTYSLEGLEDGSYVIYTDIVELDDGEADYEDAEIVEVIEESESETVEIDTTAPEIVSISSDPEDEAELSEVVTVTVLTESDLEEAYLLFEDEIYELEETITSGKYEAELVMPEEEGEYTIDVVLMDALGNEVQYRDELSIVVVTTSETDTESAEDTADSEESEADNEIIEGGDVEKVTGVMVTEDEEAVIISWEAAESDNTIAYYRVYYGPSEEALYAISDTFDSSTSWMITDLLGDQVYYFAVAAVDVEGMEGPQSDTTVGVALAKEGTSESLDAEVPTGEEEPEITYTEQPDSTPESGPATTALMLISLMGSAGYAGFRKKINK